MNKYKYIGDCRNLNGKKIQEMNNLEKFVTWKTILKYISFQEIKNLFPHYDYNGKGLHLKNDFTVAFGKSFYDGKPCYLITWSGIEFVWIKPIEKTLAEHAEEWAKENGIEFPNNRDSKKWKIMYEKWIKFAFKDFNDLLSIEYEK